MARYTDVDALLNELPDDLPYKASVKRVLMQAPAADVAPKSEVERLIGKFECFLCHVTGGRLSKHTYDLGTMESVATDCINETYNEGYGEGYKECARELFDEIYEDCFDQFGYIDYEKLAELKKKYTEEKE